MGRVKWTWFVCTGLYLLFFSWYTSLGGPLTDEEIDRYLDYFAQQRAPAPERLAMLRRFMEEDTGDDFVMVNVIDMYDTPMQIEGVEASESSDAVLNRYMQYMYPALFARASHPVLFGSASAVALDLMSAPGMEQWTSAAAMRYRSRRDLFEITTNPAFSGSHHFKVAAMEKTIAFPIDPWFQLGDPRLLLGLLLGLIACGVSCWQAVRAQRA